MRPDKLAVQLANATLWSLRSTCSRRRVGCILVDVRGHVLSSGHNGVPMGHTHCTDAPCPGSGLPSGTGLDKCQAVHAEMNAILQCRDPYEIDTCICTTAPCTICIGLLLNTSCKTIYFGEDYPHAEASRKLWEGRKRVWQKVPAQLQWLSAAIIDAYRGMDGADPGPVARLTEIEYEIARRSGHGDKGPDSN